jgi:hypothetical protein
MKNKYILILVVAFIWLLFSCKSIEYLPGDTRVEYRNVYTTDTIIKNNTTYIKEKGDTVYIWNTKEVFKYKYHTDTCMVTDTLVTYVDKVDYVEVNKLKDWQIILMVLGGILLGFIGFKLLRLFKI